MVAEQDARAADAALGAAVRPATTRLRLARRRCRAADACRDDRERDRMIRALLDRRRPAPTTESDAVAVERHHARRPRARRASACRSCRTRRSGRRSCARGSMPPLISTPLRAAPASAATIDTGVEMTSAHGHDTDEQHECRGRSTSCQLPPNTSGGTIATTARERDDRRAYARAQSARRAPARGARCACARSTRWNDARQRRVAAEARHAHVERAAPVDRAGEHLVARPLVDRQRFAGHRRLVDGALAGHDFAVERDLLAGPNDDRSCRAAMRSTSTRRSPAASRTSASDGRQVHQRANRAARAIQRPRLERLRHARRERRPWRPRTTGRAGPRRAAATSIRTLMSSDPTRKADHAFRAVTDTPAASDRTKAAMAHRPHRSARSVRLQPDRQRDRAEHGAEAAPNSPTRSRPRA